MNELIAKLFVEQPWLHWVCQQWEQDEKGKEKKGKEEGGEEEGEDGGE